MFNKTTLYINWLMLLRAIIFPSYVISIDKWLIRLVPMQAFPAGSGPRDRTTYMFTYLDATPNRPSLEQKLEDYWDLMPPYQVSLSLSFFLSLSLLLTLDYDLYQKNKQGGGIFFM
jgi:hypothetical protein